jgi:hypothetical protein
MNARPYRTVQLARQREEKGRQAETADRRARSSFATNMVRSDCGPERPAPSHLFERAAGYSRSSSRAITMRWIWFVPS